MKDVYKLYKTILQFGIVAILMLTVSMSVLADTCPEHQVQGSFVTNRYPIRVLEEGKPNYISNNTIGTEFNSHEENSMEWGVYYSAKEGFGLVAGWDSQWGKLGYEIYEDEEITRLYTFTLAPRHWGIATGREVRMSTYYALDLEKVYWCDTFDHYYEVNFPEIGVGLWEMTYPEVTYNSYEVDW